MPDPIWAEVDLDAITHNIALIRERAGRPVKLLVPVKANAYGHGAAAVGMHLESLGVDGLATANVDDAVAVRRAGATLPILLYGAQLPSGNHYVLQHDLTPTVYSAESLQIDQRAGDRLGRVVNVHIKVDAGMGRLGVRLDEAAAFAREVLPLRTFASKASIPTSRSLTTMAKHGPVDGYRHSQRWCEPSRTSTASQSISSKPRRARSSLRRCPTHSTPFHLGTSRSDCTRSRGRGPRIPATARHSRRSGPR